MNYTILGQKKQTDALVQKIIDRHVLSYLRSFLRSTATKTGKKYSTKNIEYCTIWSKDKLTKQNKISKILLKIPGNKKNLCIGSLKKVEGITVYDIEKYLNKHGAKKVIFKNPWCYQAVK
jgi:hypothetical protein|tara:strand:+ start:436 stop:795 length:360 start_codon:yes stop_codon:yes gene_type:complete